MEQYVTIILFGLLLFISCCISAADRRYDARLRLIEEKIRKGFRSPKKVLFRYCGRSF